MTTKELKSEINKTLENIPADVLQDILSYLKSIEGKSKSKVSLSINLAAILKEDKELLEKLAQ